jgi:predicted kinase
VQGRVILICGLPGAGKTTVSKQLASELGAVRMCPDEWMDALGIDLWDEPARARVESLQWRQTRELLALGVTVIIEWGVWSRTERDALREEIRAAGGLIELRFLDVPVDELWRRLEPRNAEPGQTEIGRRHLLEWAELFEAPTAEELALFDPPSATSAPV